MRGIRKHEDDAGARRWLGGLVVAMALSLAPGAQAQEAQTEQVAQARQVQPMPHSPLTMVPEQRYQLGLEAQTAGNYRVMLDEWRAAAGAGVVEAQEMLAMALLVGPALYGEAVERDLCESLRWMRSAAATGSRVGTWQVLFVNRLRQAPAAASCDS